MKETVRLHGIPKVIVSNRDSKFALNFWKGLFKSFQTNLKFSIAYHHQTHGQIERVNQVIEDMLRMHVIDIPFKLEDYLYLVEFSYNNGYHASLKMSPFEALYERKYNTLVSWDNLVDRLVIGLEMHKYVEEKIGKIKKNLKITHNRHKSYEDKSKSFREF